MKNRIKFILCAVMACLIFAGCKNENIEASDTGVTSSAAADDNTAQGEANGTFDIETVRKNIVIKGQPFEIPMALKDLPKGWTYVEKETMALDGLGLATFYFKDKEMFVGALENFYKDNKKDGIIYNTSLKTDDCSVDGIIPLKTTMQEVIEKYGEPTNINSEYDDVDIYSYGIFKPMTNMFGRFNNQALTISFDKETKIVSKISITYADFDKEYSYSDSNKGG
ncbi:MAG: hypothetical protein OSJ61_06805 [Lachnospiraceae bacterium]|nr:hypothetical protein [Lachnospiraceae bacterium]